MPPVTVSPSNGVSFPLVNPRESIIARAKECRIREIRRSIGEEASARLVILLNNGQYDSVARMAAEMAATCEELCEQAIDTAMDLPVQYAGFPKEMVHIIEAADYFTLGDLYKDWPCKLFVQDGFDVDLHHEVYRTFRIFGIIKKNRDDTYIAGENLLELH